MQVLVPCLIFLAVENVRLVKNEQLDAQKVLDSTQFKNAVAKELLKKKLLNLELARQQDSLASFLRKGGNNLLNPRTVAKSTYHKDDDPSRKQSQMANTFIASSNLLFGAKSQQRKACRASAQQTSKEGLDMRSLRQTDSGYNEEGSDFSASKEAPKQDLNAPNDSISAALQKRSSSRSSGRDPISCYLTEPKKVTCVHRDVVYKIALPSSDVADDEIGRIVESIYRAVEGKSGKALVGEATGGENKKTGVQNLDKETLSEDSLKKKRASDDYLKSVYLNNLLMSNHKPILANYNGNSPIFIPLLIPMAQAKIDQPKVPVGYYPGLTIDPKLQVPPNLAVGMDTPNGYQTGKNSVLDGYGQYLVPEGAGLPELNLKQRSQANLTAEEEKRRNWLALMATNGLVSMGNGMNSKLLAPNSINGEVQNIAGEKETFSNSNKLTVEETGEVLEKLLNKRQERDTFFLRRQLRKKPNFPEEQVQSTLLRDGRTPISSQETIKLSDDYLTGEKRGCPCPCPEICSTPPKGPKKSIKSSPKTSDNLCCSDITSTSTKNPSNTTSRTVVTCPEGCQPIQLNSCDPTMSPQTTKEISDDPCSNLDILNKVVSGSMIGYPQVNGQNQPQTRQFAGMQWMPYIPQAVRFSQQQPESANEPRFVQAVDQYTQLDIPMHPYQKQTLHHTEVLNSNQPQYSVNSNDHYLPQYSAKIEQPQQLDPATLQNQPQYSGSHRGIQLQGPNFQLSLEPLPKDAAFPQAVIEGSVVHNSGFRPSELSSKPVSQSESFNSTLKQNDLKSKKHKDSFFARLRSKFLKGIPPNGTDVKRSSTDSFQRNQNKYQSTNVQNKAVLGTSIFKFNTKNQTIGSSTLDTHASKTDYSPRKNENNLTLPTQVNNINITISSMQPHPGWTNNISQPKNQSDQTGKSNKEVTICPVKSSPQIRLTSTCSQNGKSSRITRNGTCVPTTKCTTQPTCPTSTTTTTTCATITSTTPACTTRPTCNATTTALNRNGTMTQAANGWNNRVTSSNQVPQCNQTTTCTPLATCNGGMPSNSRPQTDSPWSPPDSQVPPGIPLPPPDTSQGAGGKLQTYIQYPAQPQWNQWQRQAPEKMNYAPPMQQYNSQWQQPPRRPLPTVFLPYMQPIKEAEYNLLQPHKQLNDPTQLSTKQPQEKNPAWQQTHSLFELDPRWQSSEPVEFPPNPYPFNSFPKVSFPRRSYGQPTGFDRMQDQAMEYQPFEEQKRLESNIAPNNETIRGKRKFPWPVNVGNRIARVRRFLINKRYRHPKLLSAPSPLKLEK